MTRAAGAGGLGVPTKLLYGLGDVSNAIKMVVFGLFLLFFYTSVMGLPASVVGLVAALGLVWDAVVDPLIGHASDNLRSRFGRRHLPMLIGALGMGIAFWALLSPPQGMPTAGLIAWLVATSLLVRTMTSLFSVPYMALGAEMARDYHERTSVAAFRGGCALFGTMAAAVIAFAAFFPDTDSGVDPKLDYAGYPAMGLTFGLVLTAVALIATFSTFRWRAAATAASGRAAHFLPGMASALANRSFRVLLVSFSLFFLAVVINATLSIYYFTYYVEITDSRTISILQGGFYGGAVLGVVFWLRISRRVEKRWLYLVSTVATGLAMAAAVLLFGEGRLFGVGNAAPLMAGYPLVGFFASVLWVIPASMVADVTDQDELATGRRREGTFFGMFDFGQQVAAGLALVITGFLVDWYAGLEAGEAAQTGATAERIGFVFGLLPAALLAAAALLILRYALDRRRVAAIQEELGRDRDAKGPSGA